jgi:hypothetical protein
LAARLNQQRPVIVEGICLCQVLQQVNRKPDFLVWIENESGPRSHGRETTVACVRQFQPKKMADYRLIWRQPKPSISL